MLETLLWIIRRDVTIAMRRRTDIFVTLVFFVIVVSLFPLGIGPELETLRLIAPGVVWVGALLASMLALEQLFSADHRDGTLEQMLLTPQPLSLLDRQGDSPLADHGPAAGHHGPLACAAVRHAG